MLEKEPISKLCDELGLQPTVFYRWQKEVFENGAVAFEQKARPNHSADQDIIGFHLKNPLEDYRRLAFMMLDGDIVAVSPSGAQPSRALVEVERQAVEKGHGLHSATSSTSALAHRCFLAGTLIQHQNDPHPQRNAHGKLRDFKWAAALLFAWSDSLYLRRNRK